MWFVFFLLGGVAGILGMALLTINRMNETVEFVRTLPKLSTESREDTTRKIAEQLDEILSLLEETILTLIESNSPAIQPYLERLLQRYDSLLTYLKIFCNDQSVLMRHHKRNGDIMMRMLNFKDTANTEINNGSDADGQSGKAKRISR